MELIGVKKINGKKYYGYFERYNDILRVFGPVSKSENFAQEKTYFVFSEEDASQLFENMLFDDIDDFRI